MQALSRPEEKAFERESPAGMSFHPVTGIGAPVSSFLGVRTAGVAAVVGGTVLRFTAAVEETRETIRPDHLANSTRPFGRVMVGIGIQFAEQEVRVCSAIVRRPGSGRGTTQHQSTHGHLHAAYHASRPLDPASVIALRMARSEVMLARTAAAAKPVRNRGSSVALFFMCPKMPRRWRSSRLADPGRSPYLPRNVPKRIQWSGAALGPDRVLASPGRRHLSPRPASLPARRPADGSAHGPSSSARHGLVRAPGGEVDGPGTPAILDEDPRGPASPSRSPCSRATGWTWPYSSAITGLRNTSIPEISTSVVSPAFILRLPMLMPSLRRSSRATRPGPAPA